MSIRKRISRILQEEYFSESLGELQKVKLVEILNSLEFKDDIIAAGGEIYAVGGIVRDAIMGTPSDDLDIVVRGVPYDQLFAILSKYGNATDTSHVDDDGKKDFGSTIFISNNMDFNYYLAENGVVKDIDVMLPRKDAKDPGVKGHKGIKSDVNPMYTIEDDLQRRDITINAIAMDINGNLFTSGTGLEDIKNGVIKAVNADAFIEDPLRMLRAVRFAARYNYDWDSGTIDLVRNNVGLLADKQELPKDRFLKEFNKMIGKSDLGRAVKLMVDLGMYKAIFGIDPHIGYYNSFDRVDSIGEMAYMMFENEDWTWIRDLVYNNITNDKYILSYVDVLARYNEGIKTEPESELEWIEFLAYMFKTNKDAMLESTYIRPDDRNIVLKFQSGEFPKNANELDFKGNEFKDFVVELVTSANGQFVPREDGKKLGQAKMHAVKAIYSGEISNTASDIRSFLENTAGEWML